MRRVRSGRMLPPVSPSSKRQGWALWLLEARVARDHLAIAWVRMGERLCWDRESAKQ